MRRNNNNFGKQSENETTIPWRSHQLLIFDSRRNVWNFDMVEFILPAQRRNVLIAHDSATQKAKRLPQLWTDNNQETETTQPKKTKRTKKKEKTVSTRWKSSTREVLRLRLIAKFQMKIYCFHMHKYDITSNHYPVHITHTWNTAKSQMWILFYFSLSLLFHVNQPNHTHAHKKPMEMNFKASEK